MLCIFFPVSLSVYVGPMWWALSRIDSGISASDSFIILIAFPKTSSDYSLTLCSKPSIQKKTLLPPFFHSSTFLSRVCFTVLTWFFNKVTSNFDFLVFFTQYSFNFIHDLFLQIKNQLHLNKLSFSSYFLSSSSSILCSALALFLASALKIFP